MLKKFTTWATQKRWAVVVSIVASIPSIVLFLQQWATDHGGNWNVVVLIPALAGFIIQRKVWSQHSVDRL